MRATEQRFRHYRRDPETGARTLIWASGLGELWVPESSRDHLDIIRGDQLWKPNALHDDGEQNMLESFFRNNYTVPTTFYGALTSTTVNSDTATLAAALAGEPAESNGYDRAEWARGTTDFGATALDAGDMQTVSTTKTYNATGGDWDEDVTHFVLTDAATGTTGDIFIYNALSATRDMNDGDDLDVDMNIKLA